MTPSNSGGSVILGKKPTLEQDLITKTFEIPVRKGLVALEKKVNTWLGEHEGIQVLSTSTVLLGEKIGYVLVYQAAMSTGQAAAQPQHEITPQPPSQEVSEEQALEGEASARRGISAGAVFGDYSAFED